MADLISSLVLPKNGSNGSQESFHSVSSQPPPSSVPMPSSQAQEPTPPSSSQAQASHFQAAGLPVYDIDSYLTDPNNAELLKKTPKGSQSQHKTPQQASNSLEPVLLGSKTSHHVSALNSLCQLKGVMPIFEIDGDISNADFGGVLKIGEITIASDQRWHSKKEVKEALAEKGWDAVKTMDAKRKEPGTPGGAVRNWVGMLQEYHNLSDPNRGPVYNDYAVGSVYACECIIPFRPDQPFGSKTETFSSKKAARSNCAREAVEHLISEEQLNPDGSTKARKKAKLGAAVRIQDSGLEVKKGTSYAQKVQDFCPLLGLTSPQYILAPASTLAPNMLSGYATFPNQPGMPKEIGEVKNIFGKKNAKEEVAKGVWEVLQALAQKRNVRMKKAEGTGSD